MVSDFNRAVRIARGDDLGAVALSRLVDRVRQNLKDRVLAALQSVALRRASVDRVSGGDKDVCS